MSIAGAARDVVSQLKSDLRSDRPNAILTALNEIGRKRIAEMARDNHCSEGTVRQQLGKSVREALGAKNTGRRRQADGFSYTVLR
jgi:hypothetical protein